jgi:hypothetical protein
MDAFILQIQLLLAALSAVLPLAPARSRAQLGHVLETIAAALKLGEAAAGAAEELAQKFARLHAEVTQMAALSTHVSAEELDAAFERVRAASAAFRGAAGSAQP